MNNNNNNNSTTFPKELNKTTGYFGQFGGIFVPPTLEGKLMELRDIFLKEVIKESFQKEYINLLKDFVGRPSPLYYAKRLSELLGNKIYLKREDLNHTGSHKINNAIGQILLAKRIGAKEIIAETGAGQHGVATATVCAMMGIKCKVFMGAEDIKRQAINVDKMRILGTEIISADAGEGTLANAVDAALGYYIENPDAYYLLGSQVGPHPYPMMVGYFQSIIGKEARQQIIEKEGKLPDYLVACIGGGSNAIGLFSAFLEDENIEIHAAEGGGEGVFPGKTAATLNFGKTGVFQGTFSYGLFDEKEQPVPAWSIAAGLDYPGISPQHAFLKVEKRAKYHVVTDQEAIEAVTLLSKTEGIIPALESAHAIALLEKLLKNKKDNLVILNLSGRGDKDMGRKCLTIE